MSRTAIGHCTKSRTGPKRPRPTPVAISKEPSVLKLRYFAITCLSFTLALLGANAQVFHNDTGPLNLEAFTVEQHGGGIASNKISEDSKGYIYVANDTGTLRFDGLNWHKLPATGHNPLTVAVHIDDKDRIWVGGTQHLGYYQPNTAGTLEFKDLTEALLQELDGEELGIIWEIFSDQSLVYIVTNYHVVFWNGSDWKHHKFDVPRRILPSWINRTLYINARGSGLYRINGEQIEQVLAADPVISSGIIRVLSEKDGLYTVATVAGSIYALSRESKEKLYHYPEKELANDYVTAALRMKDGTVALGGAKQIVRIGADGKSQHWEQDTIGQVTSFHESSDGSLWAGTSKSIVRIPPILHSMFSVKSQSLARHDGALYSSTDSELSRIQMHRQKTEIETIAAGTLSFDMVSLGHHLIYCNGKELLILKDGQEIERLEVPRLYLRFAKSNYHSSAFYSSELPELSRWQVNELGVIRLNQTLDSKLIITSIADIDRKRSLFNTINNRIGILHWPPLDEVGGAPVVEILESIDGLPDRLISSRFLPLGGKALLASDKGLFIYEDDLNAFHPIDQFGLKSGNTWSDLAFCPSATDEGLVIYTKSESAPAGYQLGILHLDEAGNPLWRSLQLSGLSEVGTVLALLHEERDGRNILWVGGTKDLFRYDITDLETPPALRVNLTSIKEATGNTTLYGGFGPLPKTTNWTYPQKSLKLQFAAPPAALKAKGYQSRLVGFDDDWSELSELSFREYSNLHEGKYTFEVRAIDEFGRPGPTASFAFTILPPWYRTPHAYVGYVALVICILLLITRLWTQHLRQRNLELEATVEQRTGELKRSNLELREATAVKQDFLANMSHEIRNPLNGILGIAQLLKEEKHGDPTRVNHLNACATHLHQLLGQVLDFSSIESGRLEIRLMPFDVSQLIKDVIGMHLVLAEKKGLELHEQISHTDYLWIGDPTLLKQVLINLVSNAIKYTPSGEVRVRLEFTKSNARIRAKFMVEDTGPGIPKDKEDYIFKDFTRLNKAGESEVAGTGLGLAIASKMTGLMKGTLRIDPDYTEGARFVLELPFDTGEQKTSHAQTRRSITDHPLSGKTVLIADDMDFNRYICRELLEKLGAEVSEAEDGLDALDKLQKSKYTMAILDINMPNMDGNAVLKNYLAQLVGEPPLFIALTAHVNAKMERTAFEAGFKHFIEKPLEPEQLFQIIQKEVLRKKPDMAKDLLSYLSGGDSASKAKLKERYMRSMREQVKSLSKSIEFGNLEESPDILHKLRGLVNLRRKTNALQALDKLSAMLQANASLPDLLTACQKLQDALDAD